MRFWHWFLLWTVVIAGSLTLWAGVVSRLFRKARTLKRAVETLTRALD